MGCTIQTSKYDFLIGSIQSNPLKVKLFDTPGQCKFAILDVVTVSELDYRSW
jgi:signal recognition particle receptor subunit beta